MRCSTNSRSSAPVMRLGAASDIQALSRWTVSDLAESYPQQTPAAATSVKKITSYGLCRGSVGVARVRTQGSKSDAVWSYPLLRGQVPIQRRPAHPKVLGNVLGGVAVGA